MDLLTYQQRAKATDRTKSTNEGNVGLLTLGLQSKVGDLADHLKKYFRKSKTRNALKDDMRTSLGEALWYISSIASHMDLSLDDVAEAGLAFSNNRWTKSERTLFDPKNEMYRSQLERFPNGVQYHFYCKQDLSGKNVHKIIVKLADGTSFGDPIDDNEGYEDFYRFHDVMHISFMTFIGWSPVLRKLLKVKRKSNENVDRIEDGAKARDIEESLTRTIFNYIARNDFFEGIQEVDTDILKFIVEHVSMRTPSWARLADWEFAILQAASIMRLLIKNKGGVVESDLHKPELKYYEPTLVQSDASERIHDMRL